MPVTQPFSRSRAFPVCLARLLRWVVLATLLLTAPQIRAAYAATRVVTNTNDSGAGSLRQAVLDAAPGDTITFSPAVFSVPATITLTSGQIVINKSLTVSSGIGDIVTPTISGNNAARVFSVTTGVNVSLNQLHLVNGYCPSTNCYGGAIHSNGNLSVSNSIFISNSAPIGAGIGNDLHGVLSVSNSTFANNSAEKGGAIFNGFGSALNVIGSTFVSNTGGGIFNNFGTLAVSNSVFANNTILSANGYGGGIDSYMGTVSIVRSAFTNNSASTGAGGINNNLGTLSVSGSTFVSNSAGYGGAICASGELTVTDSIIASNSASFGNGGGIYIFFNATAMVINSTIVSNSALTTNFPSSHGGGGIRSDGTLHVINSTLSANDATPNGGGIYNSIGTATLRNTIIANSLSGGNCTNYGESSIIDSGYNLEDGSTCGFSASNHSVTNTNPLLGSLQVNPPGQLLPTLALLPGSPAIDAADDAACPLTDQRGVKRPIGAHCDIGAFELFNVHQSLFVPVVTR